MRSIREHLKKISENSEQTCKVREPCRFHIGWSIFDKIVHLVVESTIFVFYYLSSIKHLMLFIEFMYEPRFYVLLVSIFKT